MKRTKSPNRSKKWYIAMEYMPNKFGIVSGPYRSEKNALAQNVDHHHCIICTFDDRVLLFYRKNTGKWKKVKTKEINLFQHKKKKSKKFQRTK